MFLKYLNKHLALTFFDDFVIIKYTNTIYLYQSTLFLNNMIR